MAIPNRISLLLLNGVIVKETKKYLWDDNLEADSDDPVLEINTMKRAAISGSEQH